MDRDQTIREHQAFRNLLQAFARPGSLRHLSDQARDRGTALELLASCLLDAETSLSNLWEEDEDLVRGLCVLTGCRRAPAAAADFVLAGSRGAASRMRLLRTGEPDFPDRGATLVYLVDEIRPTGGAFAWKGPGIEGSVRPWIEGVPPEDWTGLREVNAGYPLGLDAVFLDGRGAVVALPRSTRLEGMRP
jgi:alpha-D-ribose 1-methylphosphonate 5-triphosphate synthase subunit PhnH